MQRSTRAADSSTQLVQQTLALILAGGCGTRLGALTQNHSKPAVPFAGKYRIIDFTLSNCINSGVRRISILTQYKSHSLNTHIMQGWNILHQHLGEYINLIPAQQRVGNDWYQGTADAVTQNLDLLQEISAKYVLILAGDHVYKMDYAPMLRHHTRLGADVTIGCLEVPLHEASSFGVMVVDSNSRIICFDEKPAIPQPMSNKPDTALASMGIYVFNRDFLIQILNSYRTSPAAHDFGRDLIPRLIPQHRIMAYSFTNESDGPAYWRDVGTVDSYYQASMDLLRPDSALDLYDEDWPIRTKQEQLPPAKFIYDDDSFRGCIANSLVAGGCIVSESRIKNSLLSDNVKVGSYSSIENSVILPDVEIGRNCVIKNAIIDSGCRIPSGTIISNNQNSDLFHDVSPGGVVLINKDMCATRVTHAA